MGVVLVNVIKTSLYMSLAILSHKFIYFAFSKKYSVKWQYFMCIVISVCMLVPLRLQVKIPKNHSTDNLLFEYKQVTGNNYFESVENNMMNAEFYSSSLETLVPTQQLNYNHIIAQLFFFLWISIAVVIIFTSIYRYLNFAKMQKRWSISIDDPTVLDLYTEISKELNLLKYPSLKISKLVDSPMLTGFKEPVILLPTYKIPLGELRLILYHELIHYKRKDLWIRMLMIITMAVHWFNPLVYLWFKDAQLICEMSCDEEVINCTGIREQKNYIDAIMGVIGKQSNYKLLLSTYFYGGNQNMKKRFLSILENKKRAYLPAMLSAFVITVGALSSNIVIVEAKNATSSAPSYISSEKAMEIALKESGGGHVVKCKTDFEDGVMVYEIEIMNDNTEYEIDINATSSEIVKYESETFINAPSKLALNDTNATNEISIEKAKEIALKRTKGGTVVKWEVDYEDKMKVYEIEVVYGNSKFDMDIGAIDSKIYNYKQQIIKKASDNSFTTTLTTSKDEINETKAKEIAIKKTGGGTVLSCYLDYENGRKVYEIIVVNKDNKYEMEIAALDGTIYDYEEKLIQQTNKRTAKNTQGESQTNASAKSDVTTKITAEKAKEIALAKVGTGTITKCELDYENGVPVYEIEIRNGKTEYEMDVNAITGAISAFDKDYED